MKKVSKQKASTKNRNSNKPTKKAISSYSITTKRLKRLKAIKNAKSALEKLLLKDWDAIDDLLDAKLGLRE